MIYGKMPSKADLATDLIAKSAIAAGLTVSNRRPFTRLRGTAWDPKDLARVNGTEIPTGRAGDYPQPYTEVVRRYIEGWGVPPFDMTKGYRSFQVANGVVYVQGTHKYYFGKCLESGCEIQQVRPASQSRKWKSVCDDCADDRRRRLTRDRVAKHRGK